MDLSIHQKTKKGEKPISWPFKNNAKAKSPEKIEDIISFNDWMPLPNLLTSSSISCNLVKKKEKNRFHIPYNNSNKTNTKTNEEVSNKKNRNNNQFLKYKNILNQIYKTLYEVLLIIDI